MLRRRLSHQLRELHVAAVAVSSYRHSLRNRPMHVSKLVLGMIACCDGLARNSSNVCSHSSVTCRKRRRPEVRDI